MLLTYLKNYNYTNAQIVNILGNKKLKTYQEESLYLKIKTINDYLFKYYKSKKIVIKITATFKEIYGYSIETLENKIDDLVKFGYLKEDILIMIKKFPNFIGYSLEENIKPTFLNLMCLTYTKKQILKMSKDLPELIGYSDKHILNHFEKLIEFGYTFKQVFSMTVRYARIFSLSIEKIKKRLDNFQKLNFTLEEIIKMTYISPQLLGYSNEKVKNTIDFLTKFGYLKLEIIQMCTNFPSIFDSSLKTLTKKLNFYRLIGIEKDLINDTHNLIQSFELSYARFQFFLLNKIIIDSSNYKELFLSEEKFIKKYNYSNEDLLQKYPYLKQNDLENVEIKKFK